MRKVIRGLPSGAATALSSVALSTVVTFSRAAASIPGRGGKMSVPWLVRSVIGMPRARASDAAPMQHDGVLGLADRGAKSIGRRSRCYRCYRKKQWRWKWN
jgi:hypothetical protein